MSLTKEEQAIIDWLEAENGRKLEPHEIHLSLEQAREMGELPRIHPDGPGYVAEEHDLPKPTPRAEGAPIPEDHYDHDYYPQDTDSRYSEEAHAEFKKIIERGKQALKEK